VVLRVLLVQHGEKEMQPGDPGLTALGRAQASATAAWLFARETPVVIWSSPLRRAAETAASIARPFALEVVCDARLRERMNWEGPPLDPIEEFRADWYQSSRDRSFVPRRGDSSVQAAERFLACLDAMARIHPQGLGLVVAHGGVTVDALRTLVGDESLLNDAPGLVEDGVPACAITTLHHDGERCQVDRLPTTAHLPPAP
jgi:broad specificity phosphatase PhoE